MKALTDKKIGDWVVVDLRLQLNRLGAATLSNLVGEDRVEVLGRILQKPVTSTSMVEMLLNRHGNKVLDEKKVRAALIDSLSDDQLAPLSMYSEGSNVSPSRTQLKKNQWGRTRKFTQGFLSLFDIDSETYWGPEPVVARTIEEIGPQKPLFPYQRTLKYAALSDLSEDSARLLIHMPTGAGKTRSTAEILADLIRCDPPGQGIVIWLAHTEELCDQAYQTLSEVWNERGDQKIQIVRLWGNADTPDVEELDRKSIVVASLQKAYSISVSSANRRFSLINFLRSNASTIVIDEAHKAIAETYQNVIEALTNVSKCRVIGLTATPGRSYDPFENRELASFFSSHKLTIVDENGVQCDDPILYLQERQYLAWITRRTIKTDCSTELTVAELNQLNRLLEIPESVLIRLAGDDLRNTRILGEIAYLNDGINKIIVFACSVEHAHLLRELCTFRDIPAHCVDGSTPSDLRKRYIQEYKEGRVRVLINCEVLTTGFDAPGTNVVLITRPTLSVVLYSQMIGRGIRGPRMGGVAECQIIDLEDNLGSSLNANQAFNFFDDSWGKQL